MQVSERKRRGNPALRAMAAKPPDISEYLRSQGFGPRELATLEVADSATIAGQLAFELNLPNSVELARAVEDIITAAKNQSGMLIRTGGTLASDLAWTQLSGSSSSPARPWLEASIVKVQIEERPPPGEKVRKLLKDGEENAARELRLQVLWTRQLAEELVAIGAPVVKTIDGCLDPDRAYELLPGKTRSSTLKRYVTMYKRWRLWLQEAKRVDPPGRPADLIDYLLVLRDEPCARTVPDSLLKSISWMERVAEFKVELRATQGRLAWAAKDKIVEVLHEGAPLIRRAPRYPVMVLVIFERVVMDDSEPTGLRVYAWAKLVKVWASLRWSDLQAIRPGELKLVEGRLATTLRRTKTSGPNRRIKEMPLCVSEAAFFENPDWLKVGFELLQWLATFSRDYLLPKLKPDFAVFEKKMAEYADVVAVSAAILQRTGMPAIVQGFWTEHSERSVLPTGLGVLGVSGPEKDLLGRWKPEGSDTYARSYGGRVAKLQLKFAVAARDENRYHVLDEREVASSLQDWLKDRHSLPEETAAEVAGKLTDKWRTGKIQVDQAPPIVLESVPDMEVEGPDADSDSQEHPDPPAAKVPRAED